MGAKGGEGGGDGHEPERARPSLANSIYRLDPAPRRLQKGRNGPSLFRPQTPTPFYLPPDMTMYTISTDTYIKPSTAADTFIRNMGFVTGPADTLAEEVGEDETEEAASMVSLDIFRGHSTCRTWY